MTGTQATDLIFINEAFTAHAVRPDQLDALLAGAWRHFGTQFFRYSLNVYRDEICRVLPLRIRLSDFSMSKSQRRNLRRNADLKLEIRWIKVTDESDALFHTHKQRFESGVPGSIYEFISYQPSTVPCAAREVAVYDGDKLIAASYFDLGEATISGIYAMFDPAYEWRGLGTFTMLKEIEFAMDSGAEFYYQGYAYEGSSFYDYKKRFSGTEVFDWKGSWSPLV